MPSEVVGLIAGRGDLPRLVAEGLKKNGRPFVVAFLESLSDTKPWAHPVAQTFGLGQVGKLLGFFKCHGVRHVVMAGGVQRPSLKSLKVDAKGALWVAKLLRGERGDDNLLRRIMGLFEAEGFQILSAQEIVQGLLKENPLEKAQGKVPRPLPEDQRSILKGFEALHLLSSLDVGQALVMKGERVIAVEGIEGTDELIRRMKPFVKEGDRLILIKGSKRQQDLRVDMPTIGVHTIELLSENGFSGVAFEAGKTFVLGGDDIIQKACDKGLFLHAHRSSQADLGKGA